MAEPKMGPSEMHALVEQLKAEGKMPELHEVLAEVANARKKYSHQILNARKEGPDESQGSGEASL